MFRSLFGSVKKILTWVVFAAFWVSLFLPECAVSSSVLAWQRGKVICAVPGCFEPVAAMVEYKQKIAPVAGSDIHEVGYCEVHAKKPPSSIESNSLGRGRILCAFGLLCLGMYVYAFIRYFPREHDSAPPPQSGKTLQFFLLTLAAVIGLNGVFWIGTRLM